MRRCHGAKSSVESQQPNDQRRGRFAHLRPVRSLRFTPGGLIVAGETFVSQWATAPTSPTTTDVGWGDPNDWPGSKASIEEHEIKVNCVGGHTMVWLNAYRDIFGNRFPIRTTKALAEVEGVEYDITSGGSCGTDGQPYALFNVYDLSYTIKVWGDILDIDGYVGRRFFWAHTISAPEPVTNPCWLSDNQTTRLAFRQEELWWDNVPEPGDDPLGWSLGGGDIGPNGEPTGRSLRYGRYQTVAMDAGFGWTTGTLAGQGPASRACLATQWTW